MENEIDIKEADKKIIFAEYLLNRPDNETYLPAAVRHILTASNIAIRYLTNIDERQASSPQLIQRALVKFEEKESIEFSKFYLSFWKSLMEPPSSANISENLRKVKAFISWVKSQKHRKNIQN